MAETGARVFSMTSMRFSRRIADEKSVAASDWPRRGKMSKGINKFNLDTDIKLAGLVFAVTGAIVPYCLAHHDSLRKFALIVPVLMNLGCSCLYIRREQELEIKPGYEFSRLQTQVRLFVFLYMVIGAGLFLFCFVV
jgi:hypothetical protein